MENKLQELTQRLYDEGLEKGRAEAERLVGEARTRAEGIVREARAEAEGLVRDARRRNEEERKNALTELTLAGREALARLRESITGLVTLRVVEPAVKAATLDPEFVKEMLLTVARNWKGDGTEAASLRALLPADRQQAFDASFERSAEELLAAGVEVGYSNEVHSGFRVGERKGGYYISFTDEDFEGLLGEYLSDRVKEMLFGDR